MTKAETKIRFLILIDISSTGSCIKSDYDLAREADTTIPFVQSVLKQMQDRREIYMASTTFGRQIMYPKKMDGKLF